MSKFFLLAGALSSASAVAFGAMGAHALRMRLDAPMLAVFQTGVSYQVYHSLALLLVGLWCRQLARPLQWREMLPLAGLCFLIGIVFFSGSLYFLALGGPGWLGPITPLGGVAFILGWLLLAASAVRPDG